MILSIRWTIYQCFEDNQPVPCRKLNIWNPPRTTKVPLVSITHVPLLCNGLITRRPGRSMYTVVGKDDVLTHTQGTANGGMPVSPQCLESRDRIMVLVFCIHSLERLGVCRMVDISLRAMLWSLQSRAIGRKINHGTKVGKLMKVGRQKTTEETGTTQMKQAPACQYFPMHKENLPTS